MELERMGIDDMRCCMRWGVPRVLLQTHDSAGGILVLYEAQNSFWWVCIWSSVCLWSGTCVHVLLDPICQNDESNENSYGAVQKPDISMVLKDLSTDQNGESHDAANQGVKCWNTVALMKMWRVCLMCVLKCWRGTYRRIQTAYSTVLNHQTFIVLHFQVILF